MRRSSTASLSSRSKLCVTGDTAKILVLYSREFVHFHHTTQSTQTTLSTHLVRRKRRRSRRDISEAIALTSDPLQRTSPTSAGHDEFGVSQPTPSRQSPYDMWLHWKLLNKESLQSLLAWVTFHSCALPPRVITIDMNHRHGPPE